MKSWQEIIDDENRKYERARVKLNMLMLVIVFLVLIAVWAVPSFN